MARPRTSPQPEVPGLAARRIAADILDGVLRRRIALDELLSGNIGRTAADVSGHPNQLDSAQFRRGWRLPGRGEGQHVVVDDLRPGGWRFGAIAPRFYRQARTATSLPRLAPW